MSKTFCSHGTTHQECIEVFDTWLTEHFNIENTQLWRTHQKSNLIIVRTRIWPDRPPFQPGDWTVDLYT